MIDTTLPQSRFFEWSFAVAALEGGRSGDVQVVAPYDGGALLAVIDGLGHGPEAAFAAETAAAILKSHPEAPIVELLARCHDALRKTRGAVMTLASVDARRSMLTWGGIGNVEAVLLRERPGKGRLQETAPLRGGVVGDRIPPLKVMELPLVYRDLLVLASDGIQSRFMQSVDPQSTPPEIVERIFERHARRSDDALVLVARYLGDNP